VYIRISPHPAYAGTFLGVVAISSKCKYHKMNAQDLQQAIHSGIGLMNSRVVLVFLLFPSGNLEVSPILPPKQKKPFLSDLLGGGLGQPLTERFQ